MRIGITGAQSTGKTTLVNALKELPQFKDYHFATERSKYLRDLGIPLNTDSTLKGQTVFLAERVSELMRENLLTDRTVIDVMAFTDASKSIGSLEKSLFKEYASNFINDYDYIFYITPKGVEIEDNGIRETNAEYRDLIDLTIQQLLKTYSNKIKNIYTISGPVNERVKQILGIINL
jgi:nicotinamide riboside kinase